jgi:hypothetical protein
MLPVLGVWVQEKTYEDEQIAAKAKPTLKRMPAG